MDQAECMANTTWEQGGGREQVIRSTDGTINIVIDIRRNKVLIVIIIFFIWFGPIFIYIEFLQSGLC